MPLKRDRDVVLQAYDEAAVLMDRAAGIVLCARSALAPQETATAAALDAAHRQIIAARQAMEAAHESGPAPGSVH